MGGKNSLWCWNSGNGKKRSLCKLQNNFNHRDKILLKNAQLCPDSPAADTCSSKETLSCGVFAILSTLGYKVHIGQSAWTAQGWAGASRQSGGPSLRVVQRRVPPSSVHSFPFTQVCCFSLVWTHFGLDVEKTKNHLTPKKACANSPDETCPLHGLAQHPSGWCALPMVAQRAGDSFSGDRKYLWKSLSSHPSGNRDLAGSDHGEGEEGKPPRLPRTLRVCGDESILLGLQPFEEVATCWAQWQSLHRGWNLAVNSNLHYPSAGTSVHDDAQALDLHFAPLYQAERANHGHPIILWGASSIGFRALWLNR